MRIQRHVALVRLHEVVAVGGHLLGRLKADEAVAAGAVLDDDLLAPQLRQLLAGHPKDAVGSAPGRERRDDPHGFGRVLLRRSGFAKQAEAECSPDRGNNKTDHFCLLDQLPLSCGGPVRRGTVR